MSRLPPALDVGCQEDKPDAGGNTEDYFNHRQDIHIQKESIGVHCGDGGDAIGDIVGFDLTVPQRPVEQPADKDERGDHRKDHCHLLPALALEVPPQRVEKPDCQQEGDEFTRLGHELDILRRQVADAGYTEQDAETIKDVDEPHSSPSRHRPRRLGRSRQVDRADIDNHCSSNIIMADDDRKIVVLPGDKVDRPVLRRVYRPVHRAAGKSGDINRLSQQVLYLLAHLPDGNRDMVAYGEKARLSIV